MSWNISVKVLSVYWIYNYVEGSCKYDKGF